MSDGHAELLSISVFYLLAGLVYMIPTIIAFRRQQPSRFAIMAVNVAFGATGIGWIGCLMWALHRVHLPADPTHSRGGQSGLNIFLHDAKVVHVAEAPGPGWWGAGRDIAWGVTKLEELNRLRDAGHLTPEEYGRLKAEVLAAVSGA